MSRTILPEQPPIFPSEAEDYSHQALERSRVATLGMPMAGNQRYGTDPQHLLDVYPAKHSGATGAPVLVFAHGGAWTNGYKEWMGLFAPAFTQAGIIFVSFDYRLAPTYRYHDMLHDCLGALTWVRDNITNHGGDPNRLFLGGHSAGGHLTMLAAWQPERLKAAGLDPTSIRGCFPLSAPLDIRYPGAASESSEARTHKMLLDGPHQAADASPVCHLHPEAPDTLIAYATDDLPRILHGNATTASRMAELGLPHSVMALPGDHFSVALDVDTPPAAWIRAVISRIQESSSN